MKINKLKMVLPIVILFPVCSCGEESFSEVTDDTEREAAFQTAIEANEKSPDYSSCLSIEEKTTTFASSTSVSISNSSFLKTTLGAKYIDGKPKTYMEWFEDQDNYIKFCTYYSEADSKYMTAFEGKNIFKSVTYECKGKVETKALGSEGSELKTLYESTDPVVQKNEINWCLSLVNIGVISFNEEYKVYKGQQGSTKLSNRNVGKDNSYIFDQSITLDKQGLIVSYDYFTEEMDGFTQSKKFTYSYNCEIPTLDLSKYQDIGDDQDQLDNMLFVFKNIKYQH